MRVNLLKWFFIIFAVGIMIFAFQKINKKETKEEENKVQNVSGGVNTSRELKLGIANFDTINPILSKNKYVQDISKLIYEPLINITKDYDTKPGIAIEWAKNGDKTYIIKLRENIKWSDGTDITANDVLYTIEKLKNIDSVYSNNVEKITRVESLNSYMVKITVKEDIPNFEYYLNFPILSSNYYGSENFQATEKNNAPIASGRYKIISNSSDTIVLEKNENYYAIKEDNLIIEKINVNLYVSVGELYNAFKLGQVDIISTNNVLIEDYIGTVGYNKREFSGREYDFLAINTQNEILQDQTVRQAINYAINKQQIVNDIYGGKYFVSNFPLDYGSWIYEKQNSTIEFVQEKVIELLEEDGWTNSYGYWQKYEDYKTKRLRFRLLVDGNNENRVEVANLIKEQLAEVRN